MVSEPWKIAFLHRFFNIEVLLKYIHHPLYGLDIGADTFGYIYKGDEHYLSFGINENNKVIMWLGDIVELSRRAILFTFRKYYLGSLHRF